MQKQTPDTISFTLPGNQRLHFTQIPAGSFLMGSPEEEVDRDRDESPQREVNIPEAFYMGTFEITQGQWEAVMGYNPAAFHRIPGNTQLPVERISWQDCQVFIYRLHRLGLGPFRLPTEAEWEYACRAGTTSRFYWGEDPEGWETHQHAWANSRSAALTHPVGQKTPNAWGLYDMSGNVWEWCQDTYARYGQSPQTDSLKVFRGGSWYDFPKSHRSANRHKHGQNQRYPAIGLRLVLDQPWKTRSIWLPDSQLMSFVQIPAGSFLMGSDSSDAYFQGDEFPAHPVTLSQDYWLGQFEVTQGQWEAVMGENPAVFQDCATCQDHPVEWVSWEDCQRFIQRLNELGKGQFRLPTEAEWEYAYRAGSTTLYPWSDDLRLRPILQHAWFNSRAEGQSHPVGRKLPNAWGLFDMGGNVWEWCQDWRGPYTAGAQVDPQGPDMGSRRIYRGGSWFNEPEALRSANRHGHPPATRQTNTGFRLVWKPL